MKKYQERLDSKENIEFPCCEDPQIQFRDGNKVCLNCGMVYGIQLVDDERKAYNVDEINKRKHTEPTWRKFGPRTILTPNKLDSKGHSFVIDKRALFSRLSKIQNSLFSGVERNFWGAKPKMKQLVLKLNIPNYIYETAWRIYTRVAKMKLTMGRSIDGFIAASVYTAIRIHGFPRLLEEVSDAAMVPRKTVVRSLGLLVKEILPALNLNYKPITPEQLVFKFGNELALPMETQKEALHILIETYKKGLSHIGKDPKGFAASAIYMAAILTKHRKTQAEISEISKITEVTLRTRIKEIKSRLNF